MSEVQFLVIAILLLATALLLLSLRQIRNGRQFALRPLSGYRALGQLVGLAVESGRRPHFTLGRGPLHTTAGPSSVAALKILDSLSAASGKSGQPPRATVGTGTLLPATQDSLRRAFDQAGRGSAFSLRDVEFLADDAFPFTYAAGTTYALSQDDTGNNIAIGRFGQEIALITEGGYREGLQQVAATDDPVAMALATAAGAETLWGEELFAAGAYLEQTPLQLASLRTQDILRWLLVAAILVIAVLHLFLLI